MDSVESGDEEFSTTILVNELSDLITYNYSSLIELFEKVGVKVNTKESDEGLTEKIIKNIPENKKLLHGIAFLIVEANNLLAEDARNDTWANTIVHIARKIGDLVAEIKTSESRTAALKRDIMDSVRVKAVKIKDRNRSTYKPEKAFVILLALGIGAYFIYSIFKSKFPSAPTTPSFGSGGGIGGNNGGLAAPDANTMPPEPLMQPNTPMPNGASNFNGGATITVTPTAGTTGSNLPSATPSIVEPIKPVV
jgi:hypothetical protein